jgi:hypothetical protein
MADREPPILSQQSVDDAGVLSRRQALTAAGALAAAGVASAQSAASGTDNLPGGAAIGIALAPANAVEFRAQFKQTGAAGENFVAFGYLTRVASVADSELYAGATLGEATALFTAYAEGTLNNRVLDGSAVHTLDVAGTLKVYQRTAPGATFVDPGSFKIGTLVAQFDVALHDILTVIMPGKGIPTLNGSMRQTHSEKLVSAPTGRRFGRNGSRARLFATGLGTLDDPVTLNSTLNMGGNWVVE